jgi:Ca2+-binding EF-hand superfamily protein
MTKEDTNRVFDFIDRDRDGKISVRDLKIASQDLGEELSGKFKFAAAAYLW